MIKPKKKLKVAYLSPLPDLRTGIADYSAMLLPSLSKYYEVEVIVDAVVSDAWINEHLVVRDVPWFKANVSQYDRVIYHIGNSSFHYYMFDLIERFPGVVVLHDFFLGHAVSGIDAMGLLPGYWSKSLYISHGEVALFEWFKELDLEKLQWVYPVNGQILKHAHGIIVHAQYSKKLADAWYGENYSANWAFIPLVRELPELPDRKALRRRYGFKQQDFLVCSFGMLGPSKLNDRLLAAWLNFEFASNYFAQLIFVGEPDNGDFGQEFSKKIAESGCSERIKITGWVDESTYHDYLVMADIAVQLRGTSRGEISAALHDCMAYGLPTIINDQDCLSEFSNKATFQISKDFNDHELAQALNLLRSKKNYRKKLADQARLRIKVHHNPEQCAAKYFEEVESFYALSSQRDLKKVEIDNAEKLSEWVLIKQLRKAHIDSEADLYLRMCAHRQLVEDELDLTKKQLEAIKKQFNTFLASPYWRLTKPIRQMVAYILKCLHLSKSTLVKIELRIKQFISTIFSYRLILIESANLRRQLKTYVAFKCPWLVNFIKFFLRRLQKNSTFSKPGHDLSRSERMVYERLKMAIKEKNQRSNNANIN
jgi:glycosyltransferase involved in cell wall biosynthesis